MLPPGMEPVILCMAKKKKKSAVGGPVTVACCALAAVLLGAIRVRGERTASALHSYGCGT